MLLGSFSLICSVSISENCSNFFQRRRNVSTQYRWYEWGRGKFQRSLRQSQAPSITLSLFFFCLSSSFPSVSVQLYALFSRRDWWRKRLRYHRKKLVHVGSHLWAVELANAGEKKELVELSGSYSIFLLRSSSMSIFIKGYRVNKSLTLPNHKTVTAAERRLIKFITRFVAYWARTIKIKIYNILENKSNVGI